MKYRLAVTLLLILFAVESHALPRGGPKSNPNAQTILKADQIDGDQARHLIIASGNVEVTRESSIVYADSITYDKQGGTIHALGHVRVKNLEIGNMLATEGEVKDDFSKGTFFNSRIFFNDGSYLMARRVDREDAMTSTLYNSVFSICPNEEISKDNSSAGLVRDFASLKSTKTVIDRNSGKIKGRNSIFKIYDIPIFYTPISSITIPSKERQTGLLSVTYFRNSNFGLGVKAPYYVNIAPNMDLTVTPLIYTGNNQFIITNDLRHIASYGEYKAQLEVANNRVTNTNNTTVVNRTKDPYRGSLITKGKFDFTHNLGADFDINTLSDRDYMRDYHFTYWAYSLSTADLHYIKGRDYYSVKTVRIQELENTTYEESAPFVLPSLDAHIETKPMFAKEKFALTSNVTSIHRQDGLQYRRATVTPEVNIPFNIKGNLFAVNSRVQTDLYSLDEHYTTTPQTTSYKSLQDNFKPEISASWRLPLIKKTPKHTIMIEPMANLVASTYTKQFTSVPNEDSNNSELTVSNLFLSDRIYGFDRNEAGQRTSYGVKSSLFNTFGEFGLTVGQSYRFKNRAQDVTIKGFSDNNYSNYIGQALYKAKKYFTLAYSFQLNQSSFSNDVNQLSAGFSKDNFRFNTDYLLLRKSNQNATQSEQLSFSTSFKMTDLWRATFAATTDLAANRMVSRSVTLLRDGCCTTFSFMVMENNPINLTKPQRTFSFLLTFKNL